MSESESKIKCETCWENNGGERDPRDQCSKCGHYRIPQEECACCGKWKNSGQLCEHPHDEKQKQLALCEWDYCHDKNAHHLSGCLHYAEPVTPPPATYTVYRNGLPPTVMNFHVVDPTPPPIFMGLVYPNPNPLPDPVDEVDCIMQQAQCTRAQAEAALKKYENMVDAILALTP